MLNIKLEKFGEAKAILFSCLILEKIWYTCASKIISKLHAIWLQNRIHYTRLSGPHKVFPAQTDGFACYFISIHT